MISRHLSALFLASLLAVACSDEGSSSQAAGGSAGDGSVAGSSGQAGAAGQGGAGAAGAAGSSGSSGQAPDGFAFTPSEGLAKLIAEVARLRAGQPADLDGDDVAESRRTEAADGSVTIEVDPDGDGVLDFFLQSDHASKKVSMLVDADSDGQPEIEITQDTSDNTETVVRSVDTDADGQVNRRQTWVTHRSKPAEQLLTEEVDTDGDGDVDETTTHTLAKAKNAGGCDGIDGFPDDESSSVELFPGSIGLSLGSSGGKCGSSDAGSIAAAIDCAVSRGGLCLANTNTQMSKALLAAVAGDSRTPITVACGNVCKGTIATTEGWSRWWPYGSRMNINPEQWNKLDAGGQCNIMLHELLHWAGADGDADHNDASGAGDDEVYSCGRYCGGCSDAGHGAPHNSAVDCARCADTPARKKQCGVQKKYVELPCAGELAGICHQGLACIAADCETCGGYEIKDCDGNTIGGEATCCASCPGSCNASNDKPCNGSKAEEDTCSGGTPPFCQK